VVRTSSRISTNKRKTSYHEQEELSGRQLEDEILSIVIKRAQGKIPKAKFLTQLHAQFPKEIMIEKLVNLTKPTSRETITYINEFLLPVMYNVTYEDDEYLAQLAQAPDKAIKNLVLAYNAAVASNLPVEEFSYPFIVSVFTNISSRGMKATILQNIDLLSVIDNPNVPLLEFLYLLRNIVLSDTGKATNEWLGRKKKRQTVTSTLIGILKRIPDEREKHSECYQLLLEVCAILSRDSNSKQVVLDSISTSDIFDILKKEIDSNMLAHATLTSLYLFAHIPLSEPSYEAKLLALVKANMKFFKDCITDLPWLDFIYIESLLTSESETMRILGVMAFNGCYDYLDVTFHTLKDLLFSEGVKAAIDNTSDKAIQTIYHDLTEKVKNEKEDEEEEGEQ